MFRPHALVVAATVAFAIATHGSAAHAQGDRAEKLFNEGQDLMRAGNVAAACGKLEESYKLDAAMGTLLNMAFCHEKQGRVGLAWREYRSAAARAQGEGQAPRAKFAAARAVEIEAKLVRAQVVPARGSDVRALRIDGDRVEGDLTVIHLEPGRHVVDVTTSAGERPVVVDARAGQTDLRIEVPAIAQLAPPPSGAPMPPLASAAPPPPAPAPAAPAEPTPASSDTKKIVGWSLVGLGALGLGLGTYFGLQTFSEKSAAEERCDGDICTAEGKRRGDKAHTFALLSTIAFAIGVGGVGVGTYLVVSPSGAGLGGSF